jgi:hypothetical protein
VAPNEWREIDMHKGSPHAIREIDHDISTVAFNFMRLSCSTHAMVVGGHEWNIVLLVDRREYPQSKRVTIVI